MVVGRPGDDSLCGEGRGMGRMSHCGDYRWLGVVIGAMLTVYVGTSALTS